MRTREQFYRCAGYYSLPFSVVPLAAVTYFSFFGCLLPFAFGAMGFWLAISGMWRGWGARICALFSLLIFVHLGFAAFAYKASF
jgi:hypothetical protein